MRRHPPLAIEKTRQAQLQLTLLKLLHAGTGSREWVAHGLLRVTYTPTDFATFKHTPDSTDILPDELEQFSSEHPFGLEVNICDSSKHSMSEITDNVLDINLANLHAVAMAKSAPPDHTGRDTITHFYHQHQQHRLDLRILSIPEHKKIERANIIVQLFFNLVATFLGETNGSNIRNWLQEHRSKRAQRNHISIQIKNDNSIGDFLTNTPGTSAHLQSYRRWYMRDSSPTASETAHNQKSEVANYAAITEAGATLHITTPPTIYISHVGQSHGSLAPAEEYLAHTAEERVTTKHELTLKSYINMQRVIKEDIRQGTLQAHVYTQLLTVSNTPKKPANQAYLFRDLRITSYALYRMIYMNFGINNTRDDTTHLQLGINNMAMIELYKHFTRAIEPDHHFPPLQEIDASLDKRYTEAKDKLHTYAIYYMLQIFKHQKLKKTHDAIWLAAVTNHLSVLRKNIKAAEAIVHLHAAEIADLIKSTVDRSSVSESITIPLGKGAHDSAKSAYYAKQAMFVIQQLMEINSDPIGSKSAFLTQHEISWKSDEANGVLQAMIQILSSLIGLHASSGCKSANDRQYVVAVTVSVIAKLMEDGAPIAGVDLKTTLATLNSHRQMECKKNASALNTVFDNGGYPKAQGGLTAPEASPSRADSRVAAGAGSRVEADTGSAPSGTDARHDNTTTPTATPFALFSLTQKQSKAVKEAQHMASSLFASHKIGERPVIPADLLVTRSRL